MLSRRNIRIKVLQCLYALSKDEVQSLRDVDKFYHKGLKDSYRLYIYNLYILLRFCQSVRKESAIKSNKYIQSEDDMLNVSKLYDNPVIQALDTSSPLSELVKSEKLAGIIDPDMIWKAFRAFAKTDEYKAYLQQADSTIDDHREIVLKVYKFLIKNEIILDHLEDHFPSWVDDESLVVGAMKKTIKALPENGDFCHDYRLDEEVTEEFGAELLQEVVRREKELDELIGPSLVNWEMDRIASLDNIIIRMGVVEMLHFTSIPTKVTINEYIDIAKHYSTPKSKDFINGILDSLMNQLKAKNLIRKSGRGLLDD